MKISKYLHSCLFIEEQDKTILIDPGEYTYNEKALDINKLTKLDYILITHEHFDHCHPPFIKELVQKFPDVNIISNPSVIELLKKVERSEIHLWRTSTEGNEFISLETLTHEKLWDKPSPQNTVFKIFDKLIHPGDSLNFKTSSEILALPITAPWGSTNEAVNKALKAKPKVIIPIHDWMWKDEIRISMYKRLEDFFKSLGIDFKKPETQENIEV